MAVRRTRGPAGRFGLTRTSSVALGERGRHELVYLIESPVEIDQIIDDGFEVHSARVVAHGKARQEALDRARPFRMQIPHPIARLLRKA